MDRTNEMNRITVRINGEDHVIIGNKPPEHIKQLANNIDKQMVAIKDKNPKLSSTKVAIMVALQLADQLHNVKEECNQLYQMLMEYEQLSEEKK